ncbi:hypothetical protein ACH5RR_027768, partial [Cinchona calisaya]
MSTQSLVAIRKLLCRCLCQDESKPKLGVTLLSNLLDIVKSVLSADMMGGT